MSEKKCDWCGYVCLVDGVLGEYTELICECGAVVVAGGDALPRPSPTMFEDVTKFNEAIGTPRAQQIGMIGGQALLLALSLIAEEQHEMMKAIAGGDLVGLSDAIADTVYVLLGLAYRCGIPFDAVWREVHAANMRKLDGPKREDGKQLKPDGWVGPDIRKALGAQR